MSLLTANELNEEGTLLLVWLVVLEGALCLERSDKSDSRIHSMEYKCISICCWSPTCCRTVLGAESKGSCFLSLPSRSVEVCCLRHRRKSCRLHPPMSSGLLRASQMGPFLKLCSFEEWLGVVPRVSLKTAGTFFFFFPRFLFILTSHLKMHCYGTGTHFLFCGYAFQPRMGWEEG